MAKNLQRDNKQAPKISLQPQNQPIVPTSIPQPAPQPPLPGASPSGSLAAQTKTDIQNAIVALEGIRKSRVIVYWLSHLARISEAVVSPLYDQLTHLGRQEKIDLFLFTTGGDTEVPWRLVSLIREYCQRFAVLVPYRALSSGTLLALGADEIIMTPLGVLGPIDPSRTHPLLPRREGAPEAEPISVQDMRHAMKFIREATGPGLETTYTPEALAQIFTALFDKIHPLAIGAIEQSYALAKLIGARCLSTHMDPVADKAKITEIVDNLCDDYKSHAYQIGRKEARAIGMKVVDANPSEEKAMMELVRLYLSWPVTQGSPTVSQSAPKKVKAHIAWLDSVGLSFRVEGDYDVGDGGVLKSVGDRWAKY